MSKDYLSKLGPVSAQFQRHETKLIKIVRVGRMETDLSARINKQLLAADFNLWENIFETILRKTLKRHMRIPARIPQPAIGKAT